MRYIAGRLARALIASALAYSEVQRGRHRSFGWTLVGSVLGVGVLAGAITGGVIGARRRPRWVPVTLPAR